MRNHRAFSIDVIVHMYETRGAAGYGREAVTQLEHALQCAELADRDGASPGFVAACLLHDLGHLVLERAPDSTTDDMHQHAVMPFLRGVFPEPVLQPIRLHVDAKRYLCAVEPGYWKSLSRASRASFEMQGGPLIGTELALFTDHPYARDAVRLRRYDDAAKVPGANTRPLAHFAAVLRSIAVTSMAVT